MVRILLYLGGLVKLLKQAVILFALLFELILKYPQLFSDCINVNLHHNLLFHQQEYKIFTTNLIFTLHIGGFPSKFFFLRIFFKRKLKHISSTAVMQRLGFCFKGPFFPCIIHHVFCILCTAPILQSG